MLDFLLAPLCQFLDLLTEEEALLFSYLSAIVLPLPAFLLAGKQDWKRSEIDGWTLLFIMSCTFAHALLFVSWFVAAVVAIFAYFAFREKEIALIGQADFVLYAHWLTASFCYSTGSGMMICASIIFLVCIYIYLQVYRDADGKKWHRGKMVPLFPPYAATVTLLTVLQYPISKAFYIAGGVK